MPDGDVGISGDLGHPGILGRGRDLFGRGQGFFGRPALIAVAAVIPMAEAAALNATAPAARALSPEVTALAPLAVFHDLRWLFGLGGAWPRFVLTLAAVVAARSVLDAVLAVLAWPRGLARPRATLLLGSSAALTMCAVLLLSPLVALTFGVALLPFSWPFLGVLPALVLFALLLSHGSAASWWWRMLPTLRAAAWLLAEFVVLSVASLLINRLPVAYAVPVAGLAGVINARAWYGVTTSLTASLTASLTTSLTVPQRARRSRPAPTRRVPVAPMAAVMAIAVVVGVARAGFAVAAAPHHHGSSSTQAGAQAGTKAGTKAVIGTGSSGQSPSQSGQSSRGAPSTAAATGQPPVLEIRGFGSSCCSAASSLRAIAGGAVAQQFSYRGLDSRGQPLPHGPAASDLPLSALGDRIAAQVERLHQETGRPVDLVAESEGTLGVYAMLARHPGVPIGSVALLSPIVAPGQVSYPADDRGARGAVPGYALQAVVWFIGGLSPFGTSGAEELINSVNQTGASYAQAAMRESSRHPMRWLAVVPLADSLTLPACQLPAHTVVVAALHGGLLGDQGVQKSVRDFFAGHPVEAESPLQEAAEAVAQAATAWRMPQLVTPSPPCSTRGN
jgi:hypothetical protein